MTVFERNVLKNMLSGRAAAVRPIAGKAMAMRAAEDGIDILKAISHAGMGTGIGRKATVLRAHAYTLNLCKSAFSLQPEGGKELFGEALPCAREAGS